MRYDLTKSVQKAIKHLKQNVTVEYFLCNYFMIVHEINFGCWTTPDVQNIYRYNDVTRQCNSGISENGKKCLKFSFLIVVSIIFNNSIE